MSAAWRPHACTRKAGNRRLEKSFCGCRIWITPKPQSLTPSVPLILAETTSSLWSNSSPGNTSRFSVDCIPPNGGTLNPSAKLILIVKRGSLGENHGTKWHQKWHLKSPENGVVLQLASVEFYGSGLAGPIIGAPGFIGIFDSGGTSMRTVVRLCSVAAVALFATSLLYAQESPDGNRKVAGGGISIP